METKKTKTKKEKISALWYDFTCTDAWLWTMRVLSIIALIIIVVFVETLLVKFLIMPDLSKSEASSISQTYFMSAPIDGIITVQDEETDDWQLSVFKEKIIEKVVEEGYTVIFNNKEKITPEAFENYKKAVERVERVSDPEPSGGYSMSFPNNGVITVEDGDTDNWYQSTGRAEIIKSLHEGYTVIFNGIEVSKPTTK